MEQIEWRNVEVGDYATPNPHSRALASYLTENKLYQIHDLWFKDGFYIRDDEDQNILCLPHKCAHLDGGSWDFYTPQAQAEANHER